MATPPLGVECGPGFEPPSAVGAGGASHFINVYENIKGWCQATQDKRQWAETYVQEVLPEHEKVLTVQTIVHRHRVPRAVAESPSLEIFNNPLDTTLCGVLWYGPA